MAMNAHCQPNALPIAPPRPIPIAAPTMPMICCSENALARVSVG